VEREGNVQPPVTVVIAAYNRESCIGEAIESVLAQRTPFPFEIIVVDDGSTDRTADIARSYGDPVRVIIKENGGPASARNAGVRAARTPLIAFLDSDDLMLPGRLARQVDFLAKRPEVVLTFGDIISDTYPGKGYLKSIHNLPFEPNRWLTVDKPYQRLLTRSNFVPNQTIMLRKNDYLQAGMMDESLRVSEDWDLWSRMTSMGKFAYYCAPFARVRRHTGDNLMSSSYRCTDMARALHGMLLRDRVLTDKERQQALALFRILLRQLLRYDLLERGRGQLLNDLREMGFWFGRSYFLQWWAISLIPPPLARLISRVRARKHGRGRILTTEQSM
jgi:glycosyltransferase involved in cell wall biosynthesis